MIAYQENDSLLAGGESVKVGALNNSVTLTYGITGSQSDKLSSDHSVNILAQCSAKLFAQQPAKTLADVSAKIYANQSGEYFLGQSAKHFANLLILTTIGGWDSSENLKRGEFTPLAKGGFSHLSKVGKSRYLNSFISKNGKIEFCESIKGKIIEFCQSIKKERIEFCQSIKKGSFVKCAIHHLRLWVIVGYSKNSLAKSSVRICTLNQLLATHDAPCVFFCVNAYAHLLNAVLYRSYSMVALVRQLSGWLDSSNSSSANLANVITPIEICTSGDDSLVKLLEIIVMMATPTQTQFKFLFLSIKRSDTTAKPCRIAVTASSEHDARLMLVRDYILSFAGRLPAIGGKHHA
ncbi:host cell division inhibitor Icd-like protein [Providencia sp. AGC89]